MAGSDYSPCSILFEGISESLLFPVLAKRMGIIPTSSSWLNLIERWFAELSQKAARRGVFRSAEELEQAIGGFLAAWNTNPTPFVWTASIEKILEKIARGRHRL